MIVEQKNRYGISHYIFLICVFILIGRPQDYFNFLVPFRLAFLFITLSAIAVFMNAKSLRNIFSEQKECKLYSLFFLIMILEIPFSYHRRLAFNSIFLLYSSNLLFCYLLVFYVDSMSKMKSVFFVLMLCNMISSALYLKHGEFVQGRYYSSGSMYDPNDISYVMVSLIPISMYFVMKRDSFIKTLLAITAIIFSFIVIAVSGSRGGYIGVIVGIICFIFIFRNDIKKSFFIAFILLFSVIVFYYYADSSITKRISSIYTISEDYNMTDFSGRLKIWEHGMNLFFSHPITGVGVSCFPEALGYYRADLNLLPKWLNAHNSFLQVAAETGLPGILMYSYLAYTIIRNFTLIRKKKLVFDNNGQFRCMVGLLQLSIITNLAASFFLSQAYSLYLPLFAACSAAARSISGKFQSENVNNSSLILISYKE